MSERKGTLYVVSAPSGTGKDTVVRELLRLHPETAFSVSATTRAPREGETEGKDYYFVTRERFAEMIERGEFLEYAEYTTASYGTPAAAYAAALTATFAARTVSSYTVIPLPRSGIRRAECRGYVPRLCR